ncbi:hypothetical protein HMPREF0083_00596 [Aneurinibacillus aneurinilyticus ATCC 12856]|uniref:Uncharacterized protein n=1 Tax=Aneurinibacillus aneurinilyticus ATCC 12856 TaxID=649747 RepID=U1WRU0_ANEAE|nr:hypothetical protein HMPREF0083_00596 [Aneurinibacillus aneurinilyticus ATCC 12856]
MMLLRKSKFVLMLFLLVSLTLPFGTFSTPNVAYGQEDQILQQDNNCVPCSLGDKSINTSEDMVKNLEIDSSENSKEKKKDNIDLGTYYKVKDNNGKDLILNKSEYMLIKDKNGIEFFVEKKYKKYIDEMKPEEINVSHLNFASDKATANMPEQKVVDVSDSAVKNDTDISRQQTGEPSKNNSRDGANILSNTGPIGDCNLLNYKQEYKIIGKRFIEERWGPGDLWCIGNVCIPTIGKWSYCEFQLQEYQTPQYRCTYRGQTTYTEGAKVYIRTTYSYGPCTYGEVGQWK